MISVLYNTIRPGGIDILRSTLKKQTEQDFEVIIVDAWKGEREKEVIAYLSDFKVTYLKGLPKEPNDVWTLNKDYNLGLSHCSGDVVLFLQDYLWIPHDGFAKMLSVHVDNPTAFVATAGHKALLPKELNDPEGKISVFKGVVSKPEGIAEADPRMEWEPGLYQVSFSWWEMNFALAPTQILHDIGGFDEDMDEHFSGDNIVVSAKAHKIGCPTILNREIEIVGYNQEALFKRPDGWEEHHSNKGYLQEKFNHILNA